MEYDKINELFEPIYEWIKEYYPNGAYFLVDKYSAKLYSNENITVFSNEIKNYSKSVLENVTADKTEKKVLFKLNSDILNGKRNEFNDDANSDNIDNAKKD